MSKLIFHSTISQEGRYRITDADIDAVNEITFKAPSGKEMPFRKVKHGEWFDKGSLSCRCSNCGCKSSKESKFCPECGADMRGDK